MAGFDTSGVKHALLTLNSLFKKINFKVFFFNFKVWHPRCVLIQCIKSG